MVTSVSKTSDFDDFDQNAYDNKFYSCSDDHPFIAFTTCYCPLCEILKENRELDKDYCELMNDHEELKETYEKIVLLASKIAPEILV